MQINLLPDFGNQDESLKYQGVAVPMGSRKTKFNESLLGLKPAVKPEKDKSHKKGKRQK